MKYLIPIIVFAVTFGLLVPDSGLGAQVDDGDRKLNSSERAEVLNSFEMLSAEEQQRALSLYDNLKNLSPQRRDLWLKRVRESKGSVLDGIRGKRLRKLRAMRPIQRARVAIAGKITLKYMKDHPEKGPEFERLSPEERTEALAQVVRKEMYLALMAIYLGAENLTEEAFTDGNLRKIIKTFEEVFISQLREDIEMLPLSDQQAIAELSAKEKRELARDISTLDLLLARGMTREERGAMHRSFLISRLNPKNTVSVRDFRSYFKGRR